jgi:hypothetical protein
MIRAKQILAFLEEWKRIHGKDVEILENPTHWQSAVRNFNKGLDREKVSHLRLIYNEKTDILKVWDGYDAVHDDLDWNNDCWLGEISVYSKTALIEDTEDSIKPVKKMPKRLQDFVSGLTVKVTHLE